MKDFIYNQKKIPKKQWRYGFRSSAATGCGWIATYNALRVLGYPASPEKIIRYYQRQLPLINGNAGTFLLGPALFFKMSGFRVKITARRKKFDETVKSSDVCILFYYWRKKFRIGAHFVTVHYQDGNYIGYNTFSTSSGPDNLGAGVEEFLKKRKYFGAVLIGIRDRDIKDGGTI